MKVSPLRSLRVRAGIAVLGVFAAGIAILAVLLIRSAERDTREEIGNRQAVLTRNVAAEIADDMRLVRTMLGEFAARIPIDRLHDSVALERAIRANGALFHFMDEVLILDGNAVVVAGWPALAGRRGRSYAEAPHNKLALESGDFVLSGPIRRQLGAARGPVIIFLVPVKDAAGKPVALLQAMITLTAPKFLRTIAGRRIGRSGYFALVDGERRVLSSPDPSRLMQVHEMNAATAALFERAARGEAAVDEDLSPAGVAVLRGAARVEGTDWLLLSILPRAEAYLPVSRMRQNVLAVSAGLLLAVGLLAWWLTGRLLAPLTQLTRAVERLRREPDGTPTLDLHGIPRESTEISTLADAFNQVLQRIAAQTAERQRVENALREGEARLAEAQRIAHLGSWEWTAATDKASWSRELCAILEVDPDQPVPGVAEQDRLYTEASMVQMRAAIARAMQAGERYEIELERVRSDGESRWLLARGERWLDANGTLIGLRGTALDITERKRAERELGRLNAELEQRVRERTAQLEAVNKELATFTYTVSHDLKAPLRGIVGYSRLLLADHAAQLDAEGRQFLDNVSAAALQMDALINDLLAYARLERLDLRVSRIVLRELVDALLAERTAELNARGVAVRLELPDDAAVSCDRDGLAMALRNLLENALKFSPPGAVPRIEIGARKTGGAWQITVRDQGIGFDMTYHDRIFQIFQRLHRSEDYAGTGVGLAIVKKAMDRMGGRVWAESAPGTGATFYLEIAQ